MNLSRNTLALALLTLIALVGIIVLLALHISVPDYLSFIATTGFGAVAGVAVPDHPAPAVRGTALPAPDRAP